MATPLTLAAIKTEMARIDPAVPVEILPGAESADRPGAFTPHSCTVHITAGGLGSRTPRQYIDDIINGDPDVPLKANAVGDPSGKIWLNAAGNSNHCLYYSQAAYDAALNATFPLAGNVNLRGGLTKWSLLAYGIEMVAATGSAVTPAQRHAMTVWVAAICRLHGWTGQETHGHGEVAQDRSWSDPGIDMGAVRRDVMALVKPAAGGSGPLPPSPDSGSRPPTTPDTPTLTEEDMRFIRIGAGPYCGIAAGLFAHFDGTYPPALANSPYEDVPWDQLAAWLRAYGCDRDIWDVRDGKFVVLDPLTGTVAPGQVWTAQKATRAAIAGITAPTIDSAAVAAALSEGLVKATADEFSKRLQA